MRVKALSEPLVPIGERSEFRFDVFNFLYDFNILTSLLSLCETKIPSFLPASELKVQL